MTTPAGYPLTLAGVVAGSNQSTNRAHLRHERLATPVRQVTGRRYIEFLGTVNPGPQNRITLVP